jgi:kumamolisin
MQSFEQAFVDATVLGITVCVAAGDNGSTDGSGGPLEVDFPASAPHALGCGGTRLDANGSITSEVVWNNGGYGTGGGVSAMFAKPTYQTDVAVPPSGAGGGRGVPDVAGDADPATGYVVRVDGSNTVIGGTSAVAPLWAGLIARLGALTGRQLGFINPVIYSPQATTAFNDITVGNNDTAGGSGQFQAVPGWDACTGLGSPRGEELLGVFGGPAAGT